MAPAIPKTEAIQSTEGIQLFPEIINGEGDEFGLDALTLTSTSKTAKDLEAVSTGTKTQRKKNTATADQSIY